MILLDFILVRAIVFTIIWYLTRASYVVRQIHKAILRVERMVKFMIVSKMLLFGLEFFQKYVKTVVFSYVLFYFFVTILLFFACLLRHDFTIFTNVMA